MVPNLKINSYSRLGTLFSYALFLLLLKKAVSGIKKDRTSSRDIKLCKYKGNGVIEKGSGI